MILSNIATIENRVWEPIRNEELLYDQIFQSGHQW